MIVEVIIPWRDSGCEYRQKSLKFLLSIYEKNFSKVSICDSEGDFNRAAARNSGVGRSNADIVVVTDADLYVPITQIHSAIELAKNYGNQIRPFSAFGHMSESATEFFLSQKNPETISDERFDTLSTLWPGLHGGTFVMNRLLWEKVGGMDENFIGWGGEDNAFNIRCSRVLNKPVGVVEGYALHLFHPYQRRMSKENALLLQSYISGNKT